ncbi:MAG: hypothetical protein GX217_04150 [Clostridiaceae bacterium]|jgi:hypothetical protein|nr:hypothetical protein [Clostridiaceae bacterium]
MIAVPCIDNNTVSYVNKEEDIFTSLFKTVETSSIFEILNKQKLASKPLENITGQRIFATGVLTTQPEQAFSNTTFNEQVIVLSGEDIFKYLIEHDFDFNIEPKEEKSIEINITSIERAMPEIYDIEEW